MRILYVITLPDLAGAQTHLLELVRGLGGEHEILVCCGARGFLTEELEADGFSTRILPSLTRPIAPLKDWHAVKELRVAIRDFTPDVVHAHSTKAGTIARIAARLEKVPSVFSAHGWIFDKGVKPLRRAIGLLVEKMMVRFTDQIITTTTSDRELGLKTLGLDQARISLVYNGFPDVELETAIPGADVEKPVILMAARFDHQKDHDTLLRGIALLNELDFEVQLLGNGHLRPKMEALAEDLGITHKLTFMGIRKDFDALLSKAHIFALITHHEGLPLSIIQAMRCGLPIICSDVSGLSEQVIHETNGLLAEENNPASVATALRALITSPEQRRTYGENSYRLFQDRFETKRMIRDTMAVYMRACSNAKSNDVPFKSGANT